MIRYAARWVWALFDFSRDFDDWMLELQEALARVFPWVDLLELDWLESLRRESLFRWTKQFLDYNESRYWSDRICFFFMQDYIDAEYIMKFECRYILIELVNCVWK